MKNSTKILFAVGAGALMGGLAGYYLNSDNGRKARKKAAKNLRKTAEEAGTKINQIAETAKSAIGDFAGEVKSYMGWITETADETIDAAQENFEKGKAAAKAKVKSMEKSLATNHKDA